MHCKVKAFHSSIQTLWGIICLLGLSLSTVEASIISWAAKNVKNDKRMVNILNTVNHVSIA